jgi:molybdopterin-guanine dinucleotide biosynthesis protein A
MTPADVTLAILAGGQGQRMGRPKSALTIADKPILQFLSERLAWAGPTILVTAPGNEHPPGATAFDAEATDPVAGEGPLRGILTALDAATTDVVAVVTVDMPAVGREQLQWQLAQLHRDGIAAMCSRMTDGVRQIEPFPLIIRRDAREMIADRVAQRRRAVRGLADEPGVRVLDAPAEWDDRVWTNLNFPDDLARFLDGLAT